MPVPESACTGTSPQSLHAIGRLLPDVQPAKDCLARLRVLKGDQAQLRYIDLSDMVTTHSLVHHVTFKYETGNQAAAA